MNTQTLLEQLQALIDQYESLIEDNRFYQEFIRDKDLGDEYQEYCREKGVIEW